MYKALKPHLRDPQAGPARQLWLSQCTAGDVSTAYSLPILKNRGHHHMSAAQQQLEVAPQQEHSRMDSSTLHAVITLGDKLQRHPQHL